MMQNIFAGGLILLVAAVLIWFWIAAEKHSDEDEDKK